MAALEALRTHLERGTGTEGAVPGATGTVRSENA
jgi:hypothetical protein